MKRTDEMRYFKDCCWKQKEDCEVLAEKNKQKWTGEHMTGNMTKTLQNGEGKQMDFQKLVFLWHVKALGSWFFLQHNEREPLQKGFCFSSLFSKQLG